MVLNDNSLFGDFNGAFNGNGFTSGNAEIEDNVMHGDFNGSFNGNAASSADAATPIESNVITAIQWQRQRQWR